MAINIEKMRAKLDALNNKGGDNNQMWKPEPGSQDIRIVCPEDSDPFKEYHFHYLKREGFFKSVLCPKRNFDDNCPICDFASQVWKESKNNDDKTGMDLAKGLFVRQRYYSPVFVRAQEEQGVRIWGYGKRAYEQLLNLVLNPDYGDITDPETGIDITLVYTKADGPGKFPTTTLTPRRKESALAETDAAVTEILEGTPTFSEIPFFARKTTKDAQLAMDEFLEEESEGGGEVVKIGGDSLTKTDQAFRDLQNS